MHESADDLAQLQQVLDDSYQVAGAHIKSIHTEERRLSAADLCAELNGACILDLATVSASHAP